jgi:hypothetical protein
MGWLGVVTRVVVLEVLLGWGESAAHAATQIIESPERIPFTGFASALAVVGDLDGDHFPDYAVGAYEYHGTQAAKQGRVFVFSGRRRTVLFTLDPPALSPEVAAAMDPTEGAAFGCALAAVGDIDQDTVSDLLVGAFGQEKSGAAYVVSGKTRMLLRTLRAPQPQAGAGFGWSVGVVGDLTGDHIPELLVGAFAQESNGRVFVFDGKDGRVVHTFVPPLGAKEGAFGWSVAGGGDRDHDGAPDILIGAPYTTVGQVSVQGRVYAFSGRTHKLLFAMDDPSPRRGEGFGWQVASGGDYNGDGVPDILIGAPYKDSDTSRAEGAAFVFNGADGSLLRALRNPAHAREYSGFGFSLASNFDLNQDGVRDILVGAPYQTVDQFHIQGKVFLFDGKDGKLLTTFDNPFPHQGSSFGYSVVSPGDITNDHVPDFVIGATGQIILDKVAVGRLYVFLSAQ